MIFVAYVSAAVRPFEEAELTDLLAKSRANNEKAGITGMLLYRDGDFMQALEGPEDRVTALLQKIAKDPRHTSFIQLLKKPVTDRAFPQWSMSYKKLSTPDELPGFSDLLTTAKGFQAFGQNPTAAQRLLLTFRDSGK